MDTIHIQHMHDPRPGETAAEAGLWLFCATAPEVIAVPHPVLRQLGGRLHCEDGPALWWTDGSQDYIWQTWSFGLTPAQYEPVVEREERPELKQRHTACC